MSLPGSDQLDDGFDSETFDQDFKSVIRTYALAHPVAHKTYNSNAQPEVIEYYYRQYQEVLLDEYQRIYDQTIDRMEEYLYNYQVTTKTPDMWKVVYFCGKAIFDNIAATAALESKTEIGKIHLTTMIGMLHLQLLRLGLDKPVLKERLYHLARNEMLFRQLGDTGAYLCYKTLANSVRALA